MPKITLSNTDQSRVMHYAVVPIYEGNGFGLGELAGALMEGDIDEKTQAETTQVNDIVPGGQAMVALKVGETVTVWLHGQRSQL